MSRGVKVSLSEKADLVEWLIGGKGSQAAWAKKQNRAPETVSRLLDDPEFQSLWAAAERGQMQRRAVVVEKALEVANDPDHINWGRAIDFLAKVGGWYKGDKVTVTVDRVAYVEPGALRERALDLYPELKN